jgi:hypothetical protein
LFLHGGPREIVKERPSGRQFRFPRFRVGTVRKRRRARAVSDKPEACCPTRRRRRPRDTRYLNENAMSQGFLCEARGSFVHVRLLCAPTQRLLEECQISMLEGMRDSSAKAVLYDFTEMQPAPINVLLYQRVLNDHLAALHIKRAIVVPNAQIAHLARLAFGGSDYRVFYGDLEGAKEYLRDASPFTSADWNVQVIEERRLRERRHTRRGDGGRRVNDRAVG